MYESREQPVLIMLGRLCHSEMFLCCEPVCHLGPQFSGALKQPIVHGTVIRFFFNAVFLSIVKYIFK